MQKAEVPNLWKPSRDAYIMAQAIPMLVTGETDLKALRARANSAVHENASFAGATR
jgi:hypothetical protein